MEEETQSKGECEEWNPIKGGKKRPCRSGGWAGFKILALVGTDIASSGTGLTLQSGTVSFKSAGST